MRGSSSLKSMPAWPIYTEWRLRRTQNQKAETHINRWLDATNLGISVLRSLAGHWAPRPGLE